MAAQQLRTRLRGLLRQIPDPDLSHLPVSLDLRAVSLAEGVRAALSVAALAAFDEIWHLPALTEAVFGALLTCFCDPGGLLERRLPALLTLGVAGAVLTTAVGILRPFGPMAVIPCVCLLIFAGAYARVWGQTAMQVGGVLAATAVLAAGRAEDLAHGLIQGGMFLAGSLWALALTMLIWRLYPNRPARKAVAGMFRRLASMAGAFSGLAAEGQPIPAPAWAEVARAHRRAVSDAAGQARSLVLDTIRVRGQTSARAEQLLMQAAAADQVFGAMVALADMLETGGTPAAAQAGPLLATLQTLLDTIADSTEAYVPVGDPAYQALTRRLIGQLAQQAAPTMFAAVVQPMLDRLDVAALLTQPEGYREDGKAPGDPSPLIERALAPLRANLRWQSDAFRHAVRTAAISAPALAVMLWIGGPSSKWMTITVILSLQPYFAVTWQRVVERIAGTVLGGVVAAGIVAVAQTPLMIAAMVFPLAVLTFSLRAVSFGLFMTCLTPLVILVAEIGNPGHSGFSLATWQVLYTTAGGIWAVLGLTLLWPSWEPFRLLDMLQKALAAHAAFADLALAGVQGREPARRDAARRAAEVASSNLEASLTRAMHEPVGSPHVKLEQVMLADAALRRLSGGLVALQFQPGLAGGADLAAWRQWLAGAFAALQAGTALPTPRPHDDPDGALSRIGRQIELMDGVLRPSGGR